MAQPMLLANRAILPKERLYGSEHPRIEQLRGDHPKSQKTSITAGYKGPKV